MHTYTGTLALEAPLERVYRFITAAADVGPCMPDVASVDVKDDTHFQARVRVGVGPVRGSFDLSAAIVPDGEGKSAALEVRGGGMGSGVDIASELQLAEVAPGSTELRWEARVTISGPLAALGARLIDGQAKRITAQLFDNIEARIRQLSEGGPREVEG